MDRIHTGGMTLFPEPAPREEQEPSFAEAFEPRLDLRPIYLLADSQLLFWGGEGGAPFLRMVRDALPAVSPRAAYLGASNGDNPDFYSIFVAAMEGISITDTRMIPASPSPDDLAFLEAADLVLLAGGDVEKGWRAFQTSGIKDAVVRRYYGGALLVGVSAGAVQMGLVGWSAGGPRGTDVLVDTFKFLPYVVDAHAEQDDWDELKAAVRLLGESVRGVGIPTGGGVVYHPDHSLEAIRHPCHEIVLRDGEIVQSLILPGTP